MNNLKELRIANYWAHNYESVVFGVDGNIIDSKSVDRKGFVSNNIFTQKSIDLYVSTILEGDLFTDGSYPRLEQRYSAPTNKTSKQSGHGTLYLSFHGKQNNGEELKTIGIVINFSPADNYDSHILFYLTDSTYRFSLKDYTSQDHGYMLGLLLKELF